MIISFFLLVPCIASSVPGDSSIIPRFADNTNVSVYFDLLSFQQCGWSSSTHIKAIELSIEKAIHVWQTTAGMKVTFQYKGSVIRSPMPSCIFSLPGVCTNVNVNEVIVVCEDDIYESNPYAIAIPRISGDYDNYPTVKPLADRGVITFYKGANGVETNWVFGSPQSVSEIDFSTVLAHELGHIYGLMHSCESLTCPLLTPEELAIAKRQLMYFSLSGGWPWNRTGPQTPDIHRMRNAWASSTNPRTDVSLNLGYSYSSTDTWISMPIDTGSIEMFQSPSVAYASALASKVWIAYFRNIYQWVRVRYGDGVSLGSYRSFTDMTTDHSPGIAISGTEIMVAAVTQVFNETTGAGRSIKVKYSPDGGSNWYTRTAIIANAPSRIDVTVTSTVSGGYQVWQVGWTDAVTFEAKAALSINDGSNWYISNFQNIPNESNVVTVGPIDLTCTTQNVCQIAYRDANALASFWMGYRSLYYNTAVFLGYLPFIQSDSGGPVVVTSTSYNGGMPARIFINGLASIGPSFDYHVNTGYGSYYRTTRALRKLQSQAQAPYTYTFVGSVLETTFDVLNTSQVTFATYPYLFGYYVEIN